MMINREAKEKCVHLLHESKVNEYLHFRDILKSIFFFSGGGRKYWKTGGKELTWRMLLGYHLRQVYMSRELILSLYWDSLYI